MFITKPIKKFNLKENTLTLNELSVTYRNISDDDREILESLISKGAYGTALLLLNNNCKLESINGARVTNNKLVKFLNESNKLLKECTKETDARNFKPLTNIGNLEIMENANYIARGKGNKLIVEDFRGYDYWGPKDGEPIEGECIIQFYNGPGNLEYLCKARNGKFVWRDSSRQDSEPYVFKSYDDALKQVNKLGGEILDYHKEYLCEGVDKLNDPEAPIDIDTELYYENKIKEDFGYAISQIDGYDIEDYAYDEDTDPYHEVWIYTKDNYIVDEMECHTVHEYTYEECYNVLSGGITEVIEEARKQIDKLGGEILDYHKEYLGESKYKLSPIVKGGTPEEGNTIEYGGWVASIDENNVDAPEENLVQFFKSKEDFENGDVYDTVSFVVYNNPDAEQEIIDWMKNNYIDELNEAEGTQCSDIAPKLDYDLVRRSKRKTKKKKLKEATELENGSDCSSMFDNYEAFRRNFGDIIIVKDKYDKNYKVYLPSRTDINDYIYFSNSKDNIEGWLYGAVQANNGIFKNISEKIVESIIDRKRNKLLESAKSFKNKPNKSFGKNKKKEGK